MPREQSHEVQLPVPPAEAFEMLVTPSRIRDWWSASAAIVMPFEGGGYAVVWGDEDEPDYATTAVISEWVENKSLTLTDYRYFAKSGPLPFEAEFTTRFTLEPTADGCIIRVVQAGFPDDSAADGYFEGCRQGWQQTLAAIRERAGS